GKYLVLFGERLKARQRLAYGIAQAVAAGVDSPPVEGRAAIKAVKAVPGQNETKGGRNGDAPLGVEPIRIGGYEVVQHTAPSVAATGGRRAAGRPFPNAPPAMPGRRCDNPAHGHRAHAGVIWDGMG